MFVLVFFLHCHIFASAKDHLKHNSKRTWSDIYNRQPCVPSEGFTALVIGQDFFSITNYTTAIGILPFGFMSYTALKSNTGSLTGLDTPINYGSGIEWAKGLVDKYPAQSLQVGLYLVNELDEILSGALNDEIDRLGEFFHSLPITIYLRIGYEFDFDANQYDTQKYILVFRKIVNDFHEIQVTNVHYVWHATGFQSRNGLSVEDWYPGEEYVDWCGISLFQQPYDCNEEFQCFFPYADKLITFCKSKNHPVMIAESTPFGGIIDESVAARKNDKNDKSTTSGSNTATGVHPSSSSSSSSSLSPKKYRDFNFFYYDDIDAYDYYYDSHSKEPNSTESMHDYLYPDGEYDDGLDTSELYKDYGGSSRGAEYPDVDPFSDPYLDPELEMETEPPVRSAFWAVPNRTLRARQQLSQQQHRHRRERILGHVQQQQLQQQQQMQQKQQSVGGSRQQSLASSELTSNTELHNTNSHTISSVTDIDMEIGNDISSNIYISEGQGINGAGYEGDTWKRWFSNVINYIEHHDIRMWSYINCDWDAQPMWQTNHAKDVQWGDSRVEAYVGIRQKWITEVLQSKRYNWVSNPRIMAQVCSSGDVDGKFSSLPVVLIILACIVVIVVIFITMYARSRHPNSNGGYTVIQ